MLRHSETMQVTHNPSDDIQFYTKMIAGILQEFKALGVPVFKDDKGKCHIAFDPNQFSNEEQVQAMKIRVKQLNEFVTKINEAREKLRKFRKLN